MKTKIKINEISSNQLLDNLENLTDILHACVNANASVGFVLPYTVGTARDFWQNTVLPPLKNRERIVLIATIGNRAVGTVQLQIVMLPNQDHRAEVAKLLVHPDFRGRGIAKLLMAELEIHARRWGKSLITLDTRTGDTAEPLYSALGYEIAGVIPGYCRAPEENRFDATTYMYKKLDST